MRRNSASWKCCSGFCFTGKDLNDFRLSDFRGKRVVLNIFPSLDTEVCATSVRKFNQKAAAFENTVVVCVSADLPFAAGRFCSVNGIENVITGSTFRSEFGDAFGVRIADGPMRGLMARIVIVLDENGTIIAQSLCDKITDEPDYSLVETVLSK